MRGRWVKFSTHSIRSCKHLILWLRTNEEKVVALEALKLSKCSLHFRIRGCGLEGKLFERPWECNFGFKGEDAIFDQMKIRDEKKT